MSTHVVGVVPSSDIKFHSFLKIYNECEAFGITPPQEVLRFFGGEKPDPAGMIVDISFATEEYNNDMQIGLEVDIRKLPIHVKTLRFVNSY